MRLDPPAVLRAAHDLRVRRAARSCRSGSIACSLVPPAGGARTASCLVPTALSTTSPSRTGSVRVHQAGDQGLAEAEAGLHGGDLAVARDGVGREQDAGRLREDHPLHDHGHPDLAVVHAVPQAVGHGPFGEERGPAAADVLQDRRRPDDVQVRVLLAREGGRRQVLGRGTGADGVGGLLAEPGERPGDRGRQIVGDGDASMVRLISVLSARMASRSSGFRRDSRRADRRSTALPP